MKLFLFQVLWEWAAHSLRRTGPIVPRLFHHPGQHGEEERGIHFLKSEEEDGGCAHDIQETETYCQCVGLACQDQGMVISNVFAL